MVTTVKLQSPFEYSWWVTLIAILMGAAAIAMLAYVVYRVMKLRPVKKKEVQKPAARKINMTADMLYPPGFLQVVGHTPVRRMLEQENMITLDVFSTYSDGTKFGNEEFYWVDTVSKEYGMI